MEPKARSSNLLRCTNQTHVRYLEILGTATCVCVFTPFFTDFPMPYPFSPYSLMVYTANLDYLSPDFLPRKSGFYHIYTIYMVEIGYGWQAVSHGCTTKNGILSQKISGHRGRLKKHKPLRKKFYPIT